MKYVLFVAAGAAIVLGGLYVYGKRKAAATGAPGSAGNSTYPPPPPARDTAPGPGGIREL